jgi:hypothetical protein
MQAGEGSGRSRPAQKRGTAYVGTKTCRWGKPE